jgi:hypothetical protein
MKRPMTPHQLEHSVYQCLPFVVGEHTKWPQLSQVFRLVRIAARTTKRAFSGDFDGEDRMISADYPSKGAGESTDFHSD